MEENTNQASSSIKVVKFTSGEEVVAIVLESENEIVISDPAKVVVYTSSNDQGQVVECLRLTSYLANTKETQMSILKNYIIYITDPSEDLLKMYNAYLSFMSGNTFDSMVAELQDDPEPLEMAWTLLSDANFIQFMQELYEDNNFDIEEIEEIETFEAPITETPKEEAKKEKKKKKKYKKDELKLPYTPEGDIADPKSWSDNPEDYLK